MNLDQDLTQVPGQLFAICSFVGHDLTIKFDEMMAPLGVTKESPLYGETFERFKDACKFAVRISGVFATSEEAGRHAQKLQKEDASADRYVVDLYKWSLVPPDPEKIADVQYTDEKLNEIMTKYRENQREANIMFHKRKKALVEGHVDPSDENSAFYTKADEEPISHPADHLDRLRSENPEATDEELAKMADEVVQNEIKMKQKGKIQVP